MDPALQETPVEHRPVPPTTRAPFDPLQLFADHGFAARVWCLVALIAVGYAAVAPYFLVRRSRLKEKVVILDPAGTFHVSPLLGFEESGRMHEQHAMLACLALFQRNPAGLDHPELLQKLFLSEAAGAAQELVARTAEEFAAKQLHQKAEILKLTVLETRENQVLVQAEGQLVRTGLFEGAVFAEAPAFRIRFTFARNPDMATNGRFPLAVWSFDLS